MLILHLRAAFAHLRVHKVTTLINVAGLTLGTVCFVVAYAVASYFQSTNREFANADRIHVLEQRNVVPGEDAAATFSPAPSASLAKYVAAEAPELVAVARKTGRQSVQITVGDRHRRMQVTFADPKLLRIFDYTFVAGDAGALDGTNSAVLAAPTAEALFGTRDAVGKTFTIDRRFDVVVTAVVEQPDPLSSGRIDVMLNMALRELLQSRGRAPAGSAPAPDDWTIQGLNVNTATFVLLPADGTLPSTELERRLAAIAERIVLPRGEQVAFRVRPVAKHLEDTLTAGFEQLGIAPGISAVQLFFLPALLVLAMACFNYVNLATAIAATRAKDVGLSRVLGAGKRTVLAKYFLEAVLAVVTGVALGLLLAIPGLEVVRNLTGMQMGLANLATLEFALATGAVAGVTSVAAGVYPAFVMSRFQPIEALRNGSRRSGSSFAKSLFIGVQFTVASVLLTAVVVMYAQNTAMRAGIWQQGADPLVQLPVSLESVGLDPEVLAAELERAPEVRGVTGQRTFVWSSRAEPGEYSPSRADGVAPVSIQNRFISYDFFATLGVELVAGREFARGRDLVARPDAPTQTGALGVILDREAASMLGWLRPGEALGQVLYERGGAGASARALEVIGVVERAPLSLMNPGVRGSIYHLDPYDALPIVRLAPDGVAAGVQHVQNVWERLTGSSRADVTSGAVPVFVDDALEEALRAMNGLTTALLSVVTFGFLVALAGIFGMALFVANRRRHEIGVRKTLGAGSRQILRQLLVEFGRPVLIANVVAWPLGYLLADVYVDWFVARMTFTPWPYVLSLVITLGLAWLGVGTQALRAARLIPAQVLRNE